MTVWGLGLRPVVAWCYGNAFYSETMDSTARGHAEQVHPELSGDRVVRLQSVIAALMGTLTPEEGADTVLLQAIEALRAHAGSVVLVTEDEWSRLNAAERIARAEAEAGRARWYNLFKPRQNSIGASVHHLWPNDRAHFCLSFAGTACEVDSQPVRAKDQISSARARSVGEINRPAPRSWKVASASERCLRASSDSPADESILP